MFELNLAAATIIFCIVTAYYARLQCFSLFHPLTIFLAFHFLVFVARPWMDYIYNYDDLYSVYKFMPTNGERITVIWVSVFSMLTFLFFSVRFGGDEMKFKIDDAVTLERKRLFPTFLWVAGVCTPIAFYSLIKTASGNFDGMVMDRASGIAVNTTVNGYALDSQLMLVSLCAIVAWVGRFRAIYFLPLAAFVTLRASFGGRGPFVAAIVCTALLYLYEKRLKYPGLRVVLMLVPLLMLFRFVGDDRGSSIKNLIDGGSTTAAVVDEQGSEPPLASMDYANQVFLEYLVHVVPNKSGTFDYFLDNLQIFTEPVPRVLWTGKPVGAPIKLFNLFDYGFPIGMTRSIAGEGWFALGWVGVFIWSALYGAFTGFVYNKFVRSQQSNIVVAAYMVFLSSLIVAYRDGALLTLVRSAGVYLTPVFLWYLLSRFFGLPRLADIRAAMSRQVLTGPHGAVAGQEPAAALTPVPALGIVSTRTGRALPPAVSRRRLALQRLTDLSEGA
jgi:oligosaccharide repeat unit polymerase